MEKKLDSRTFIIEQNIAEGTQNVTEVKKQEDRDVRTMVTFEESPKVMESEKHTESEQSSESDEILAKESDIEKERSEIEKTEEQK